MWLDSFPLEISPKAVIYDCMDELSLFKGAPERLRANERQLMEWADLVFTGGVSLFEFKREMHPRTYPFPSGVDVAHFARARACSEEREEQRRSRIPGWDSRASLMNASIWADTAGRRKSSRLALRDDRSGGEN